MIRRIDSKPTYSEIVIHGSTVYLSGQVPWNTSGLGIEEQTKEVLSLIDAQLHRAGSHRTKLLSMQVFLKDPADYAAFNQVFTAWIPESVTPARNTICGIQFPNPDWKLEIVVIAAQ
jgi:enamine deaminase RidA (YjgF/YER057c/UK114 family)